MVALADELCRSLSLLLPSSPFFLSIAQSLVVRSSVEVRKRHRSFSRRNANAIPSIYFFIFVSLLFSFSLFPRLSFFFDSLRTSSPVSCCLRSIRSSVEVRKRHGSFSRRNANFAISRRLVVVGSRRKQVGS